MSSSMLLPFSSAMTVELLVVGVDSDGGDDGLDVSRRRLSVATEDGQKVSSHVTHVNFKSRRTRNVLSAQVVNLNRAPC